MIDRVIGIDFSAAAAAGKCIWLTQLVIADGKFRIEHCVAAAELPGSGIAREQCLPALVDFIASQRATVIGCDFPFSPHASMIKANCWRDFALAFGARHGSAEHFMSDCRHLGNGRELKRACDREARVPFAAYNLRIYRQTFHGIRDFLAPLVRDHGVRVLPMERPAPNRPWLVETCPASTLKSIDLYPSYKGVGGAQRLARQAIIRGLVEKGLLGGLPDRIAQTAIDNSGGDALDSIIAACATARCLLAGQFEEHVDETSRLEGRVYF